MRTRALILLLAVAQLSIGVRFGVGGQVKGLLSGLGQPASTPDRYAQFGDWAAARIPRDGAIVFLQAPPRNSAAVSQSFVHYFEATQELQPRTVWNAALGSPAADVQNVDVPVAVPADSDGFTRFLVAKGVAWVLVSGVAPSALPARAGPEITWFDMASLMYLVRWR